MTTAERDEANPAPEAEAADGDAGEFVRALLADQLADLRAVEPDVRSHHIEGIHAARTAARRMRSTLASYQSVLVADVDQDTLDDLRDGLRWLGQELSPARDAEVVRDRLLDRLDGQSADLVLGPVQERVRSALDEDVTRGIARAAAALDSPRYARLLAGIEAVATPTGVRTAAPERAQQAARHALERDVARLLTAVSAADDVAGPSAGRDLVLHEVRKKAKRLRYSALSSTELLGKPARTLARATHRVQDALGAHQDSVVAREVLATLADAAQEAGEPTFTYGRLHALEEAAAGTAEHDFASARRRLDKRARPFVT